MYNKRSAIVFGVSFLIILAIGLGIRIYYAIISSKVIDSDTATIGLMALHILKGDLPLFFYGQEYIGPIEAYMMAIYFGVSIKPFSVIQTAS